MSKTHVPLDRIEDNPFQSRIDTGNVESLAEKILDHGLRQLPEGRLFVDDYQPDSYSTFTEHSNGEWWLSGEKGRAQLATGHRRVLAVQLLNDDDTVTDACLEEVGLPPGHAPIDLQRLDDEQMLDLLTIENAAREELTAIEQARLIEEHREAGRSQAEIAETFGRSRSWVSNRKRLLEYPQRIRDHIHEGDLSVRQANAMQLIFEADWRSLDWPEDNSFHPTAIMEKALDGRSSEDLRRDVKQFESWMRQLSGETQQEIRKKEYEQELESHSQDDGSETDQPREDDGDRSSVDEHATPETPPSSTNDRGSRERSSGSVRRDADRSQEESDDGKRNRSSRSTAPVGGDGARAPDREEVQEVIREVASTLADEIDSDVLTRHLVLLGAPSKGAVRTQVKEVLRKHTDMQELDGRVEAIQFFDDWLAELGYDIELPEHSPVGEVNSGEIDMLLSNDEETWDPDTAMMASIADLLVAHRVASKRGEQWRAEAISKEVRERKGTITEEDFPDAVWSETQDEIDRRIQAMEHNE